MNQFDTEYTELVLLRSENRRLSSEGEIMVDALKMIADMKPIPGMEDAVLMRGCARAALSSVEQVQK